jgi:glyoxylase-like metal-dependent hydrolase (beta-lactamase superfamily II)
MGSRIYVGDRFKVGEIDAHVMYSPGRTLASVSYIIGEAAFVHDTLFMPDAGTARTDFPGGSARQLRRSIQQIISLPGRHTVHRHDYQPGERKPLWESSLATENVHLRRAQTEEKFVKLRQSPDCTLPMRKLILPALQVNPRWPLTRSGIEWKALSQNPSRRATRGDMERNGKLRKAV